eukprot:m.536 g.536  ORF g.536 m.536 type:complete len:55 (+) comp748_c0_seq1:1428-1592(+)
MESLNISFINMETCDVQSILSMGCQVYILRLDAMLTMELLACSYDSVENNLKKH